MAQKLSHVFFQLNTEEVTMDEQKVTINGKDVIRDQQQILMPGLDRPSSMAQLPGKEVDITIEDDEERTSVKEVKEFQDYVSRFLNGNKVEALLQMPDWMGMENGGKTFSDLNRDDATQLIKFLGVGSFKVMRFSPNLLPKIKSARENNQQIVSSGGSCEITSADNRDWRKKRFTPEEFLAKQKLLPSLMQIYDASLPIKVAKQYVNIIEDSLFAEFGREFSSPALRDEELRAMFYNEGVVHSEKFQSLIKLYNQKAKVTPAFFSQLPMQEFNQRFWESRGIFPYVARNRIADIHKISRSQVMFSFTGHFANMLREVGLIERDSCYLVVEPFHHFTETHNSRQFGAVNSPIFRFNMTANRIFKDNPYGVPGSENEGTAGAIAFLPVLCPDAQLGHNQMKLDQAITRQTVNQDFSKRQEALNAKKVVNMWEDIILADGINHLYFKRKCRRAIIKLIDLNFHILKETKNQKKLRKELRNDKGFARIAREAHEVLLDEFENLVLNLVC